jgi:hypothetical protein
MCQASICCEISKKKEHGARDIVLNPGHSQEHLSPCVQWQGILPHPPRPRWDLPQVPLLPRGLPSQAGGHSPMGGKEADWQWTAQLQRAVGGPAGAAGQGGQLLGWPWSSGQRELSSSSQHRPTSHRQLDRTFSPSCQPGLHSCSC